MSGEGQNINPEMYIGKKRGEELVCVVKDGSQIHIMEHRGWQSQLHIACEVDNVQFIQSLVNNKSLNVNTHMTDSDGVPLYIACANNSLNTVVVLLSMPSVNLNAVNSQGKTPLYAACANGNKRIVDLLLDRNSININKATSDNGQTPLYGACTGGHVEVVNALLKHNSIDINKATSDTGETPLYVACKGGHIEIVNTLVKHDSIDIHKATSDNSQTPLYVACEGGHIEIVNALLKHDSIDINKATSDTGETPLHAACSSKSWETLDLAKLLLASGADCSIENNNGSKPYGFNEDGTLNEGMFDDY